MTLTQGDLKKIGLETTDAAQVDALAAAAAAPLAAQADDQE